MIYKSVDTIPSKVFFKILRTGDLGLLTDETIPLSELEKIWINIEGEDSELTSNGKNDRFINISKQIEAILAKMESINLSVFHLKILRDQDLIENLKKYNYKFTDDLKSDLIKIERETEALTLKLRNYQRQLDKILPKNNKKHIPFDEVVMGYGVVSGWSVRPNEITQSEYRALIKIGNQKIKALSGGN